MKRTALATVLLSLCASCRDSAAPHAVVPVHYDLLSIDGQALPAAVGPAPHACTDNLIQQETIAIGQPTDDGISGLKLTNCMANISRAYQYHLEQSRSGSRLVLRYFDVGAGSAGPVLWADTGVVSDSTLLLRAHYAPPDTGVNMKLFRAAR